MTSNITTGASGISFSAVREPPDMNLPFALGKVRSAARRWRCHWLLLLAVGSCAVGADLQRASAEAAARPANRWLLVVQTSRTMQPRAAAVQDLVGDLIRSGMKGQLHSGDTLGLWTFNEKISAGQLPLQVWDPEQADAIATRTVAFLRGLKCEKKSHLDQVLPVLAELVTNSDVITILLVTDGREKLTGTPFDAQVNSLFELWGDRQKQAKLPFLTVLRGVAGKLQEFAINTPPAPLKLPPLPPEWQYPEPPAAKAVTVERASSTPPLILSGRKPASPETNTTLPVIARIETPSAPAEPVRENPAVLIVEPVASAAASAPTVIGVKKSDRPPAAPAKSVAAAIPTAETKHELAPASSPPRSEPPLPAPAVSQPIRPAMAAPVAAALPPETFFDHYGRLIFGLAFAVVTLASVIVRLRLLRSRPRASLITRSLDREQK